MTKLVREAKLQQSITERLSSPNYSAHVAGNRCRSTQNPSSACTSCSYCCRSWTTRRVPFAHWHSLQASYHPWVLHLPVVHHALFTAADSLSGRHEALTESDNQILIFPHVHSATIPVICKTFRLTNGVMVTRSLSAQTLRRGSVIRSAKQIVFQGGAWMLQMLVLDKWETQMVSLLQVCWGG